MLFYDVSKNRDVSDGKLLPIYDLDDLHRTDAWDRGSHTVCAVMTSEFLEYTKSMGNDLSTPRFETRHTFLSHANM